jgi:hypothetical protein
MSGLSIDEMLWAIEPTAWDATGLNPEAIAPHVDEMLRISLDTMGMILAPTVQKRA